MRAGFQNHPRTVARVAAEPESHQLDRTNSRARTGNEPDNDHTNTPTATHIGRLFLLSFELEVEYAVPIHVPMVDVHTIGAGGGSVAFVNEAGLLQVGPVSAGAAPGPICFGRGGERVTITDANLLLGRLNPHTLLSVERPVPLDSIASRFDEQIGTPLGLGAEEAAAAVLRIANDRMAGALRMVSLSRGHDPRDFALFAFGGAGPLHAADLARELGIPKVVVPARPGITNALGCMVADLRHDFVRTVNTPLAALDARTVHETLAEQIRRGCASRRSSSSSAG